MEKMTDAVSLEVCVFVGSRGAMLKANRDVGLGREVGRPWARQAQGPLSGR